MAGSLGAVTIIFTTRARWCGAHHRTRTPSWLNWGAMAKKPGTVRIAAVGDVHLGGKGLDPPLQILFGQVSEHADILALCGDLTDRGDPEEAKLMAKALATVAVPIVAVLGNHDYECG